MAYEELKNSIKQAIKQNGNQEITGDVMQDTLLNMVNIIESKGLNFKGLVNPRSSINPSTGSFYCCVEIGNYEAFGVTKLDNYISFIMHDGQKWYLQAVNWPNFTAAAVISSTSVTSLKNFSWIENDPDGYQFKSDFMAVKLDDNYIAVEFKSFCKKYKLELYNADRKLLTYYEFTNSGVVHLDNSIVENTKFAVVSVCSTWQFTTVDSPFMVFCLAYVTVLCSVRALELLCSNIEAVERLSSCCMNSYTESIEAGTTKKLYVFQKPNSGIGNRIELFLSDALKNLKINVSFYDCNTLLLQTYTLQHTDNKHISIEYDTYAEGLSKKSIKDMINISVVVIEITNNAGSDLQVKAVARNVRPSEIRENVQAEYENLLKSNKYSLIKASPSKHPLYVTCNLKAGKHYKIYVSGNLPEVSSSVRDMNNTEINILLLFYVRAADKNDAKVTIFDFWPDKDYAEIGFSDSTKGLAIFEEKDDNQRNQYNFGEIHSEMFVAKDIANKKDYLYTFDKNSVKAFTEYVLEIDCTKAIAFSISSINNAGTLVDKDLAVIGRNYTVASKPVGNSDMIVATFKTKQAAAGFKFYLLDNTGDYNIRVAVYERTEASKKSTCINPLSYEDCSDPTIWEDETTKCAYALGSPWAFTNRGLLCSTDKKTWHLIDNYYPFDGATENILLKYTSGIWAPSIFKIGEKFRIYSGLVKPTESTIAIFESNSAFGKFKYLKSILSSEETGIPDTIDPCVVYGEDSRLYLFYGSIGGIYRVELEQDGLSAKTNPVLVVKCTQQDGTRDKSYEGVYLYWHDGYWYMFISAGNFNKDYRLCVGRSKTITGEFVDRQNNRLLDGLATTILQGDSQEVFYSPGHNGEIFIENGKYYIYFHAISNINYGEFNSALGKIAKRYLFKQELKWSSVDGFPEFDNLALCNVFNY